MHESSTSPTWFTLLLSTTRIESKLQPKEESKSLCCMSWNRASKWRNTHQPGLHRTSYHAGAKIVVFPEPLCKERKLFQIIARSYQGNMMKQIKDFSFQTLTRTRPALIEHSCPHYLIQVQPTPCPTCQPINLESLLEKKDTKYNCIPESQKHFQVQIIWPEQKVHCQMPSAKYPVTEIF